MRTNIYQIATPFSTTTRINTSKRPNGRRGIGRINCRWCHVFFAKLADRGSNKARHRHCAERALRCKKPHTGLTVAQRFVATFADGSSLFVKAEMDDFTEKCLRVDHLIMSTIKEDFVPAVVDWLEPPGQRPVLLIDDMSGAHWSADCDPVLWKLGQFEILFETLKRVAAGDGQPQLVGVGRNRRRTRKISAVGAVL